MVAVSFALGFALTYMFGYEDETDGESTERAQNLAKKKKLASSSPNKMKQSKLLSLVMLSLLLMSMTQSSQVELWDKVSL